MKSWVGTLSFITGMGSCLFASLVSSPEKDWPQWRGPYRDGVSSEQGLLQSWPKDGPSLTWKVEGLGKGYSSPVIHNGKLYITGDVEDHLIIFAMDLDGKKLWSVPNGQSWKKSYPGARATCAYSEGALYHLNAHGRLLSMSAETGKENWALNVLETFEGENIRWGLSEGLLVDGDKINVTVGGAKGLMVALDKHSAKTIWASEAVEGEKAGYASPILFLHHGKKYLANCSSKYLFVVEAENGNLMWKQPRPTRYEVLGATPVYYKGGLFVASPDGAEGGYCPMDKNGLCEGPEWTTSFDNVHGGMMAIGDRLYGGGHKAVKGWAALDLNNGEILYTLDQYKMGSATYADGRIYALTQDGKALLLAPQEKEFEVKGEFSIVTKRVKNAWTYPVIYQGKLYLRYNETLFCYQIKEG